MAERRPMVEHGFCWSARPGLTLAEALRAAAPLLVPAGQSATALLYSADRCRLGRLAKDGKLSGPDGQTLPMAGAFEARAFSPHAELRWLHEGQGRGRAVLLADAEPEAGSEAARCWSGGGEADEEAGPGGAAPATWHTEACLATMEQSYLLWGAAGPAGPPGPDRPVAGWTRLIEARIGALDVPLELPEGYRARLRAREYLGDTGDGHGNVALLEERLLELVPYAVPAAEAHAPAGEQEWEVRHG